MKYLRGPDLTDHQLALVSAWWSGRTDPRSQRLFDDAFKVSLALDMAKQAHEGATKPTRRMAKRLRALEARITPPKKRRAIEERQPIVACVHKYIKAHGPPANLTGLIKRLRMGGVLTKTCFGKKYPISNTTARNILRGVFGLTGPRGRP